MSLNLEAMVLNSPEVQALLATAIPPVPEPALPTAARMLETDLARMMRDPLYWRERNPEFVARVTAGFGKLVGIA